jgi:hypothetical protein
MKSPCELLDVEEIVMYASSLNEGTLARRDEFVDDRRKVRTFVIIFATLWMRLMVLKSPIESAPSFLGIRIIFALFRRFRSWLRKLYKESIAAIMSRRMIGQQTLKKRPVKPSGPGALSCGMR